MQQIQIICSLRHGILSSSLSTRTAIRQSIFIKIALLNIWHALFVEWFIGVYGCEIGWKIVVNQVYLPLNNLRFLWFCFIVIYGLLGLLGRVVIVNFNVMTTMIICGLMCLLNFCRRIGFWARRMAARLSLIKITLLLLLLPYHTFPCRIELIQ